MRKIVLIAALAVAAASASAQNWSKGDWFTGAQVDGLGVNHTSYKGYKSTEIGLAANVGYFFTNRLAFDATVGFNNTNSTTSVVTGTGTVDVKEKGTTAAFGLGLRVYPVGNLFARVGYDLAAAKSVNPWNQIGLTVGYDLFVADNVFLTPAVYYKKGLKNNMRPASNDFGLQMGFGVRF